MSDQNQTTKIELELDEDQFPQLLKRYSLGQIKDMAASMALKQYSARPITEAMLYSCLANLESDLSGMFPNN
jgi:hypothetical protein